MVEFNMLCKARKDGKRKAVFGKKEQAMQLLVSFRFSGCEFHVFLFDK